MRASKPSLTARHVALTRASFDRPNVPTGDAEAEARLYRSLGSSHLPRTDAGTRRMQARTVFFDREALGAIERGVTQIVIVAAGYDGRALRFATPGVRWFEVDHPHTQKDKRDRMAAAGIPERGVTFVSADLTADDLAAGLSEAGHDPSLPSMFIVEGLLGYLTREVTARLLSTLHMLASGGSRMAAGFPTYPRGAKSSETLRLKLRGAVVALVGEPWLVRFEPDEPDLLLEAAGWRIGQSLRRDGSPARYEGRNGVLVAAEPL